MGWVGSWRGLGADVGECWRGAALGARKRSGGGRGCWGSVLEGARAAGGEEEGWGSVHGAGGQGVTAATAVQRQFLSAGGGGQCRVRAVRRWSMGGAASVGCYWSMAASLWRFYSGSVIMAGGDDKQ
ncbi:unnamed protein product [Cuscuta europaea]|uniref:Uncharacterized protein n=1 Tax=Cuscuta europaea TaxID=41803 RepID=A0A9P0Z176_CUSEU|nr:unnamed protein product [Cuscuta europaea]